MKKFHLVMAIFLIATLASAGAYAFSTDDHNYTNSDGTPKFTDPDEDKPAFVLTPGDGQNNIAPASSATAPMSAMPRLMALPPPGFRSGSSPSGN